VKEIICDFCDQPHDYSFEKRYTKEERFDTLYGLLEETLVMMAPDEWRCEKDDKNYKYVCEFKSARHKIKVIGYIDDQDYYVFDIHMIPITKVWFTHSYYNTEINGKRIERIYEHAEKNKEYKFVLKSNDIYQLDMIFVELIVRMWDLKPYEKDLI